MKDKLSEEQSLAILKALDDAIEHGPWDKSNFLRVIGKNLQDIRDGFHSKTTPLDHHEAKIALSIADRVKLHSGQQEIFITLYSSDGTNLQAWERIIINLPKQMLSRPIYAEEEDVKSFIKTKENKNNEAYASFFINPSDILILSTEKTHLDKLGKPLLTLKDNALSLENVERFVHVSGEYQFVKGRLVKKL
jgi:intracellular multiplication protein IcmQ